MTPAETDRAVASAVMDAAERMRYLDPGPIAELRRMTPEAPAAAFWRVAVHHGIMQLGAPRHRDWVTILRLVALLVPRGEVAVQQGGPDAGKRVRPRLHDYGRPLGAVLCDGGDPDWLPAADPPDGVVSERRLVMFLATRGQARADALERIVRMIAPGIGASLSRPDAPRGVDAVQIAAAILWPERTAPIAEAYFRRLDRAARDQSEESKT